MRTGGVLKNATMHSLAAFNSSSGSPKNPAEFIRRSALIENKRPKIGHALLPAACPAKFLHIEIELRRLAPNPLFRKKESIGLHENSR